MKEQIREDIKGEIDARGWRSQHYVANGFGHLPFQIRKIYLGFRGDLISNPIEDVIEREI